MGARPHTQRAGLPACLRDVVETCQKGLPLACQHAGPELWAQTEGRLTHVVCAMGSTSGTIMGISAYLKALNPELQVVGVQPDAASSVPGWERCAP